MRDSKPGVVVVNSSMPEMDYLAAALHRRAMLRCYVRPYANRDRWWERALHRLPGMRAVEQDTVGRRACGAALAGATLREAGVVLDFAAAAVRRSGAPEAMTLSRELLRHREDAIAAAGAREVRASDAAVVANFGVALPAFRVAKRRGGLAVLNYPIAHHRFAARVLEEEAEREPEFAATLVAQQYPRELEGRMDAECALADLILVGSEFVRRSFLREGCAPGKIAVVPYGTDLTRFHPRKECRDAGRFRILFAGQITQRKGISYLLRAYESIRGADTELLLVGSCGGQERVFAPYRHLFRHSPPLPRAAMAEIYHSADVLVLPTLLEGLPLVVLEAMACGLPVIATARGAEQIVRDGIDGFLVPVRDAAALAAKLELLRRDRELRRHMGANAARRAAEFGWESYMHGVGEAIAAQLAARPTWDLESILRGECCAQGTGVAAFELMSGHDERIM